MNKSSRGPSRVGVALTDDGERPIVDFDGRVFDLSEVLGETAPTTTLELIEGWEEFGPRLVEPDGGEELDPAGLRWAPSIVPAKVICVGANYRDHLEEMEKAGGPKIDPTPFPFSFLKPQTALIGSGEPVPMPSFGQELDWEAEVAVVIGDAAAASGPDPLAGVFGYTILNDLSLRDFVAPFAHPLGLDALISKGFDGASPIGPWITRAESAGRPDSWSIELRVNGDPRQSSSTEQMIFSVAQLVAYYARVLTLEPGDVIATGTPAGVGMGMETPRFLAPGDEIEIEIEGLGTQRTPISAPRSQESLEIR